MRLRSRVLSGSPSGSTSGATSAAVGSPGAAPALLVTGDPTLHDAVVRLAAAAAVRIEVVGTAEEALLRWPSAGVVLVGADLVASLAELRPPSRREVHVLTGGSGDAVYRHALGIGAQGVVELPRAEAWLTDLLADLADGHVRQARTVAVVAGSGGAGASVLAATLAQVGARDRAVTLVDLDPGGGGADRLLGVGHCGVHGVMHTHGSAELDAHARHHAPAAIAQAEDPLFDLYYTVLVIIVATRHEVMLALAAEPVPSRASLSEQDTNRATAARSAPRVSNFG